MHSNTLPQPGSIWGLYPEKRASGRDSAWTNRLNAFAMRLGRPGLRRYDRIAQRSLEIEQGLASLSGRAFDRAVRSLKQQFARDGLTAENIAQAFALTADACRRHLGMVPFAAQRVAAAIMLDNQLAEMATGEGKTLAAALTAATGALAGIPVHVVTANEYLVNRDANRLRPVYAALGLTVGAVQQRMDGNWRRAEYARDITYCTAKELVFDYLRDLPVRSRYRTDLAWHAAQFSQTSSSQATLLRGLCMAVIDEADSILIDEARVPLIISELHEHAGKREAAAQILALAATLRPDGDFTLDAHTQSARLTEQGRATLEDKAGSLHAVWRHRRQREENLCLALAALHLFQRDRHYLVRDDCVHIIDDTTGRVAPGRTWSRGLHQLIELKEKCKVSGEAVTRAQITYQRFFPRFLRLCGMSGTLAESRAELSRVYGLNVVRVPLRKPSQRNEMGRQVFMRREQHWQAVAERVAEFTHMGRPVLIGTDSVADSESLSGHLAARGVTHKVLNARNDQEEADIIALAGHAGHVTVTTNMAGRGTDIPLGPGVAKRGGLHVICCQMNSARRIDRQLKGRGARQGDPGSAETLLCLESPLIQRTLPVWLMRVAEKLSQPQGGALPAWLGGLLTGFTQRVEESRQQAQRALLLYQDQQLDRLALFRE
ncbi:MAG TPA: DEAD/DEAH box helicase [Rhodocyclaceae bacterium]|nr:DEAD/DEAH box helicase [Rhodocyclaceae bacterium]